MGAPSLSFMPVITASGTLLEGFPDVDPNFEPFGAIILLQQRVAKSDTGGDTPLALPEEVRATIQANTQVAKVIAMGPLAFKDRRTGEPWPEGAWVKPGDYVRTPKFIQEKWEVRHGEGVVVFMTLKDLELSGRVPRPLDMIAYV